VTVGATTEWTASALALDALAVTQSIQSIQSYE
jgi:hypothetical protein